jgi:hypothetical protein
MHSMRTRLLHSAFVSGYYVFTVVYSMLLLLKLILYYIVKVTMYSYYKPMPKTEAIN